MNLPGVPICHQSGRAIGFWPLQIYPSPIFEHPCSFCGESQVGTAGGKISKRNLKITIFKKSFENLVTKKNLTHAGGAHAEMGGPGEPEESV